jgi:hypothetical protein
MIRTIILTAAIGAAALPALAEDRREAGAHEHGHGQLDIAIEGRQVSMALDVPAADIVGFEHEAKTKDQKAKVAAAKKTLADPLKVFAVPADAGCKLANAKVEFGSEKGHDHGHKHKEDGGKAEAEHSEIRAEYTLDCAAPEKITGIEFKYFELFSGAEELDVNVASDKGQTKYEVTRKKPSVTIGEVG